MSQFLYVTNDRIAEESGGGIVTYHESEALRTLATSECPLSIASANTFSGLPDPWGPDDILSEQTVYLEDARLAHFYAGTWTKTISRLRGFGCKVVHTAAAHSIEISKEEHERLGVKFSYPHLTDPEQWCRYVGGYLDSDVLVCPSTHSAEVMKSYGYDGRLEVIPHGVSIPEEITPLPTHFTVGYLGAIGPDKGLIYLLQAWKKLAYRDATLVLAGRHTTTPFMAKLIHEYGGGNIQLQGWVKSPSDLYNQCSLYVQPSCSEGFGIEVLEAMAHGRPVLCSTGAGAADVVPEAWTFPARDVEELASKIDTTKIVLSHLGDPNWQKQWVDGTRDYTWDNIRERYVKIWKEVLNGVDQG